MKTIKTLKYIPIVALAILAGCKGKETAAEVVEQKMKVTVAPTIQESVEQLSEYTGTVESFVQNNISPSMPLRIDKVLVDVGDRVVAGQVVAIMDNTQYSQTLLQLENQELDLKRIENLLKAGAVAQQDYDNLKAQVDITRKSVDNLKRNMQLTSPISGIVTARNYDSGDMYAAQPIVTVMQMQPVKVLISVQEIYFPKVKKGMEVKVKLDTYPDRVFTGSIYLVHPTIDQFTRTFSVEVSIPNGDMSIRPGMFARVELGFGSIKRVVISDKAVMKQEGSNERYVFTVEDGVAHRKLVELGRRMSDKFEVISGVSEGEQVVTTGQSRLLEGTKVEIQQN